MHVGPISDLGKSGEDPVGYKYQEFVRSRLAAGTVVGDLAQAGFGDLARAGFGDYRCCPPMVSQAVATVAAKESCALRDLARIGFGRIGEKCPLAEILKEKKDRK
jgi:hypothetical protein